MGWEVVVDPPLGEAKRLRPSTAFVYLAEGEIPPEDYPEFALEEVRRARKVYYRRHVVKKRPIEELYDQVRAYGPSRMFRRWGKLITADGAPPMISDGPPLI